MKKIGILFILIFLCLKTNAQSAAEDQLGAWYMYNGSHKLNEKYSLQTMAHFRYYEIASDFQQEIYRLGINYKFNPKMNLTLGASYSTGNLAYDEESPLLYEWRLYEDFNINSNWRKFKARHRLRLEHRFIHKNINTDETQNWFRYDLNVNYPINNTWSIYVFNEIFLNLDKSEVFAQNWTGAGFLRKINKNLKVKFGYFQIKQNSRTLKRVRVGLLLNTDFF